MLLVNTESVPGRKITRVLGLVSGNTVRSKDIGSDIAASFQNLVGGELKEYTGLLDDARREAVSRMIKQAENMNANAIVNVRFSTSAITKMACELYAYGTAVVLEEDGQ